MINFTKDEINNLLIFLDRCKLTGKESTTHARLKFKLQTLLNPTPTKPTKPINSKDEK